MAEDAKPLQATFDVGEYDAETVEGTGFEPGVRYTFTIDKEPRGKFMQYGTKRTDGLAGLFYLKDKGKTGAPKELLEGYHKHPDQYEIFTSGEVNGQQALVPGKDYDQFRPFMTRIIDVGWKCVENGRLIFMSLNDAGSPIVNPTHPKWESVSVKLARRMNYDPPEANINGKKNPEHFSWNFLHVGVEITAEVEEVKNKNPEYKDQTLIIIDTVELAGDAGKVEPQKKLADAEDDADMKMTVMELAEGCKTQAEVIKKVREHVTGLKLSKPESSEMLGKFSTLIVKMKQSKEILA